LHAEEGPNPYHQHELKAEEFVAELSRVFSNVRLLLQNHVESFAFHPSSSFWPAEARIDGGAGAANEAHFLIGMCSRGDLPEARSFVYVPRAANLLHEREQHRKELAACVKLLETAESTVDERTLWAQAAEAQRQELLGQLNMIRASRWWKLGRKLELGPIIQP